MPSPLQQLKDCYEEQAIRLARKDLLAFTRYTKPDYEVGWHHLALSKKLNDFAEGKTQYLMVFMPPRHGKSELVSRRLPAYLHGRYPDCEIMAVSYLDSLAGDMAASVQSIIDSKEYVRVFPETRIWPTMTSYTKGTRNSSEHDIVGRRGKYRGQGVGGSFTGKGANFIIVDDPIKGREIADSETFRDRLWNFWTNDLFSRLETDIKTGRQGQCLITQTRWHEDDLSGRLIEQMKKQPKAVQWEIVHFPAIRVDMDNPDDPRKIGEPLWPKKYDLKKLEEIKASLEGSIRAWSAVYQQDPLPGDGAVFKDSMFQCVDIPQSFDWTFTTADTAYKEREENDFTCFSVWGVLGKDLYLIDIFHKQIRSSDIEREVQPFLESKIGYGYRATLIEPKGHGIYLNQLWATKNLMIPSESDLKEFFSDRRVDKVERSSNVVPHLAHRKIYVGNHIPNKEGLIAQCLGFPKVKHDDFCFVGETKIAATFGDVEIKNIKAGDFVITPFGPRKVLAAGYTGRRATIKKFGLEATPDHPIFQYGIGFIPIDTVSDVFNDRLSCKSLIRWIVLRQLFLMEYCLEEWEGRDAIILVSQKVMKEEKVLKVCMSLFLNFSLERKFARAFMFIIKIAIHSTTNLVIWSIYRLKSTESYQRILTLSSKQNIWKRLDHWLLLGTDLKRVGNGTVRTLKIEFLKRKELFVSSAAKIFGASFRMLNIVPIRVRIKGAVIFQDISKKENVLFAKKISPPIQNLNTIDHQRPAPLVVEEPCGMQGVVQDVYNLTVDGGCYYANGILVSNCDTVIDALKKVHGRATSILDVL